MVVDRVGDELDLFCKSSTLYQWSYKSALPTPQQSTSHKIAQQGEEHEMIESRFKNSISVDNTFYCRKVNEIVLLSKFSPNQFASILT